jgi:hypothetical protein
VVRLKSDLSPLGEAMKSAGLHYEPLSEETSNLLSTSGFATGMWVFGVRLAMYTPQPVEHVFDCGILIQVLDDGRHRLYAAHRVGRHQSGMQVVWSEHHEADSGSSQESQVVNSLIDGLQKNLKHGLAHFLDVVSGNPPSVRRA